MRWTRLVLPIGTIGIAMSLGPLGLILGSGQTAPTATIDTSLQSIVGGLTSKAIADSFQRAIPVREFAIDLFNAVAFYGFGNARKGALIGKDGWLFSTEEY